LIQTTTISVFKFKSYLLIKKVESGGTVGDKRFYYYMLHLLLAQV